MVAETKAKLKSESPNISDQGSVDVKKEDKKTPAKESTSADTSPKTGSTAKSNDEPKVESTTAVHRDLNP